ncbi:MAG: tRNA (N6-threonylcarbamoyladenosine(37)-N6)-methyltransferase TrmO [Kiritimatiellia bacterium]
MEFEPIGVYRGDATYKYEMPRQGVFAGGRGRVELNPGRNFEMALRDLEGFERLWILFVFDRNGGGWRPTARPPVAAPGLGRVGVFASRSPYRPNPIGLSCVRLLAVRGRVLDVSEADLLDGSPVLDVKPYVPAADAFPAARAGWVGAQTGETWTVAASSGFAAKAAFVRARGGLDVLNAARVQLSRAPFDATRKRVTRDTATSGTLALRMFRLDFSVEAASRTIVLQDLRSGYSAAELADADDPHADKNLHRAFVSALHHC